MNTSLPATQPIGSPGLSRANPAAPAHPASEDLVCYALQFFSGGEAATIDRHIERCPECRAELARIHSDIAVCAASVDLELPPAAARRRFIQQVAREKKVAAAMPANDHPPIAAFGRSSSMLTPLPDQEESLPQHSAGPTTFAVITWLVAAALAAAVFLMYKDGQSLRNNLAIQAGLIQRLDADAATAHQLMDALTDPKAVRVTLASTPPPRAQPAGGVTYDPSKGSLVFLAGNLDPLQPGKTYELWIMPAGGAAPIPAGTFHPDDQGNASVIMPDLPKGMPAKSFEVSIEADGGSQTPTPPIVLSGS